MRIRNSQFADCSSPETSWTSQKVGASGASESNDSSSDGEGGAASAGATASPAASAAASATASATASAALIFPDVSSGAALALGFGTAHDGCSQDTFVLCDRLTRSGVRATATGSEFGLAPARRHLAEGGQELPEEAEECAERQSFYAVCVSLKLLCLRKLFLFFCFLLTLIYHPDRIRLLQLRRPRTWGGARVSIPRTSSCLRGDAPAYVFNRPRRGALCLRR